MVYLDVLLYGSVELEACVQQEVDRGVDGAGHLLCVHQLQPEGGRAETQGQQKDQCWRTLCTVVGRKRKQVYKCSVLIIYTELGGENFR